MKYFLSIDYGGTNTKAIIFDEDGNEIGVSSFHTMRKEVKPDYREVDLKETSDAIYDSIKKALKKYKGNVIEFSFSDKGIEAWTLNDK